LLSIGGAFSFLVLLYMVNADTAPLPAPLPAPAPAPLPAPLPASAPASPPPMFVPFLNQTSTGYAKEVWGKTEIFDIPAAWYWDGLLKRARLDVGAPGQDSWRVTKYCLSNGTYKVVPKDGKISCTWIPDYTIDDLAHFYGSDYLGYVGRRNVGENGDVTSDFWVGEVLTIDGPTLTLFYTSPQDGHFMGLIQGGTIQSNVSFSEVWFDNTKLVIPDGSVFIRPPECDHPETFRVFDKWNLDGTLKQQLNR